MDSDKLNVQCTYPRCSKWFETENDMKYHKKSDPEHFYCKKCNVDCEDWDDLTQHKVKAMEPWLDGRMKHRKDEDEPKYWKDEDDPKHSEEKDGPMHIVCEFCGMDFKSFGGRKAHRKQVKKYRYWVFYDYTLTRATESSSRTRRSVP